MKLLQHPADARQLGFVAAYWVCLALPYFLPSFRHPVVLLAACGLSFLNAVVIHNVMHVPVFRARGARAAFRAALSFGNLYPASANIPAHNRVHHRFSDDGLPDWAAADHVRLPHPLLTLIHFPNVVGPNTFAGVSRFARRSSSARFRRQYLFELVFSMGATALLLALDFFPALLFVVVPQLFGARWILRINLLQHDGAATESRWNHSRNFLGRTFNWLMMNNGYHTVHHMHPSLHWSELPEAHARLAEAHVDPELNEGSLGGFISRAYVRGPRP